MIRNPKLLAFALLFAPAFANLTFGGEGQSKTLQQEKIVLEGKESFATVRHVVLRGSNVEIGRALAELGKAHFQMKPAVSVDADRTRIQRKYFEHNYPILLDRMKGVAEAFGTDVSNDKLVLSHLGYTKLRASCSVIYLPASKTTDGKPMFSRDYDFSTGGLYGEPLLPGQKSPSSTPFIIEMHPDKGYASLAVCCYDLLSGVLDGMNSEGLCVALLADDQLMRSPGMEPTGDISVGLGVQQALRLMLDTCANVEQAKEVLLTNKLYYEALPCHFVVADRHGKSFVLEYSVAHNKEYIIDGVKDRAFVNTNFSMHKFTKNGVPPTAEVVSKNCPRYCLLTQTIEKSKEPMSADEIKKLHGRVDAKFPGRMGVALRTLWHSLYFPETRKLQVSFYMGDVVDAAAAGGKSVKRSEYFEFSLVDGTAATASTR